MAGKGGGAWKVAYADFVTAMMAFFMVMWITSQGKDIKEAVAHHFREPFEPMVAGEGHPPEGKFDSKVKARRTSWTPTSEEDAPGAVRPRVLVMRRGEHSGTATVIFFHADSVELDSEAMTRLEAFVPQLLGKPQLVEIRGHTARGPVRDEHSTGDDWEISYARCRATMEFLEELGVPVERMRLRQAASYEPYLESDDASSLTRNPRVEVLLLSETVEREWRSETKGQGELKAEH